jgi:hypothetical protein
VEEEEEEEEEDKDEEEEEAENEEEEEELGPNSKRDRACTDSSLKSLSFRSKDVNEKGREEEEKDDDDEDEEGEEEEEFTAAGLIPSIMIAVVSSSISFPAKHKETRPTDGVFCSALTNSFAFECVCVSSFPSSPFCCCCCGGRRVVNFISFASTRLEIESWKEEEEEEEAERRAGVLNSRNWIEERWATRAAKSMRLFVEESEEMKERKRML